MSKKKLIHFQENLTFPHLFQPSLKDLEKRFPLQNSWNEEFFDNDHPIVLELGCGKGEYTLGLAGKYPEKNFIGIDLKGARLWRGCKTVAEEKMKNVAFIRTRVDHIESIFGRQEVSEIWITFPDPQPGKVRKRLTAPGFINRYKNILKNENMIHLKTDDQNFFIYTMGIIGELGYKLLFSTNNLYDSGYVGDASAFRTYYEQMWIEKGKPICYLQFKI